MLKKIKLSNEIKTFFEIITLNFYQIEILIALF